MSSFKLSSNLKPEDFGSLLVPMIRKFAENGVLVMTHEELTMQGNCDITAISDGESLVLVYSEGEEDGQGN